MNTTYLDDRDQVAWLEPTTMEEMMDDDSADDNDESVW